MDIICMYVCMYVYIYMHKSLTCSSLIVTELDDFI